MKQFFQPLMTGLTALGILTGFVTGMNTAYAGSTPSVEGLIETIGNANSQVRSGAESACPTCDILAASQGDLQIRESAPRKMHRQCSAIMDSQGDLGPIGQSLFEIMDSEKYVGFFTQDNSLGRFCPKFNSLSDSQKMLAWTWFWTALASEESSCKPNRLHATTYIDKKGRRRILNPRPGYGLWALEKDRNIRRGRGRACDNISTPHGQALCAIDIMVKNPVMKRSTGDINTNSYWGPVRRGQSQIIPHMKRLSLCF